METSRGHATKRTCAARLGRGKTNALETEHDGQVLGAPGEPKNRLSFSVHPTADSPALLHSGHAWSTEPAVFALGLSRYSRRLWPPAHLTHFGGGSRPVDHESIARNGLSRSRCQRCSRVAASLPRCRVADERRIRNRFCRAVARLHGRHRWSTPPKRFGFERTPCESVVGRRR